MTHILLARTSLVKTFSPRYRLFPSMTSSTLSSTLPPSLTHWPGYLLTFIAEHATERFERAVAEHGIRSGTPPCSS